MTLTPEQRERYWAAYVSAVASGAIGHSAGLEAVALAAQRDLLSQMREDLKGALLENGDGYQMYLDWAIPWLDSYLPADPSPQEDQ